MAARGRLAEASKRRARAAGVVGAGVVGGGGAAVGVTPGAAVRVEVTVVAGVDSRLVRTPVPSRVSAPPQPRKPEPASEPQRPRSLYGSSRRKLNPSELNKRPKPE